MDISSRTPEGEYNRCPTCGKRFWLDPSRPPGDAPCPFCGTLVWFPKASFEVLPNRWQERSAVPSGIQSAAAGERQKTSIVKFMPTAPLLRFMAWSSFFWLAANWMARRLPVGGLVFGVLLLVVLSVLRNLIAAYCRSFRRAPLARPNLDLPLTWGQAVLVVAFVVALGVGGSWLALGGFPH